MERPPVPTDNLIQQAEQLRTRGKVADAAALMNPDEQTPRVFPSLNPPDQTKVLMASRIHAVSQTSLARRSFRAKSVALHLGKARTTIERIYRDPFIELAAQYAKQDNSGNPYEFSTEMARDEVKYMLTLAQLTGNASFLTTAIQRLNVVIQHAEEPSAKTLVQFEQAQLFYQQEPTKESFTHLRTSYESATDASIGNANWERVATIASRYAISSLRQRNLRELIRGLQGWTNAVRNNRAVSSILPREIYKQTTQGIRERIWRRTTPRGANYSTLAL